MEKFKLKFKKEDLIKRIEVNYRTLFKKDEDELFSSIQVLVTKNKIVFMNNNDEGIIKSYLSLTEARDGDKVEFSVNGSNFFNAVRSLNSVDAELIIQDNKMTVKGGRRKYELMFQNTSSIYKVEEVTVEKLNVNDFVKVIENSLFCLSSDKHAKIMHCVYFGKDKTLAGDGYRFTSLNVKTPIKDMALPGKMLEEIFTILKTYDEVPEFKYSPSPDMKHAIFRIGEDYYFSVVVPDERYPKQMGDNVDEYKNKVICNTQDFLDVVQNFSTILDDNYRTLNIEVGDRVKMYINTSSCKGEDEIEMIRKESITSTAIKCNYKYMLEVLRQIKSKESFTIEISDDKRRCNIRTDDENFIHPICLMSSD